MLYQSLQSSETQWLATTVVPLSTNKQQEIAFQVKALKELIYLKYNACIYFYWKLIVITFTCVKLNKIPHILK